MPDVNLDGGAVDMHTEQTSTAMDRLALIGTTFQAAWDSAMRRVDSTRAALNGTDRMNGAFAALVDGPAGGVRDQIQGASGPGKVTAVYADAGEQAVRDYLAADAAGRAAMPG